MLVATTRARPVTAPAPLHDVVGPDSPLIGESTAVSDPATRIATGRDVGADRVTPFWSNSSPAESDAIGTQRSSGAAAWLNVPSASPVAAWRRAHT
jgi:hypothetical protein